MNHGRNNGKPDDPVRIGKLQKAVAGDLKVPQKAYLWVLRNPNLSASISEMDTLEKMKDNIHPTSLIEQADRALYYAKENGRNQIRHFDQLIEQGLLEQISFKDDIDLF